MNEEEQDFLQRLIAHIRADELLPYNEAVIIVFLINIPFWTWWCVGKMTSRPGVLPANNRL